jgi:hypothetical protein
MEYNKTSSTKMMEENNTSRTTETVRNTSPTEKTLDNTSRATETVCNNTSPTKMMGGSNTNPQVDKEDIIVIDTVDKNTFISFLEENY